MNTKKLLALVLAGFLFSACGKKDEETTNTGAVAPYGYDQYGNPVPGPGGGYGQGGCVPLFQQGGYYGQATPAYNTSIGGIPVVAFGFSSQSVQMNSVSIQISNVTIGGGGNYGGGNQLILRGGDQQSRVLINAQAYTQSTNAGWVTGSLAITQNGLSKIYTYTGGRPVCVQNAALQLARDNYGTYGYVTMQLRDLTSNATGTVTLDISGYPIW